jgi:hypothetical protein
LFWGRGWEQTEEVECHSWGVRQGYSSTSRSSETAEIESVTRPFLLLQKLVHAAIGRLEGFFSILLFAWESGDRSAPMLERRKEKHTVPLSQRGVFAVGGREEGFDTRERERESVSIVDILLVDATTPCSPSAGTPTQSRAASCHPQAQAMLAGGGRLTNGTGGGRGDQGPGSP